VACRHPINDEAALMKYNAGAAGYCTQSMTLKGLQYGLAEFSAQPCHLGRRVGSALP
jgi:hypothetical protein